MTFYILLSLFAPKHGYAVMQFIEEKGWIARYGDNEGRKKEYLITVLGKEIAEKELARLQELTQIAAKIMGGSYDQEMLPHIFSFFVFGSLACFMCCK